MAAWWFAATSSVVPNHLIRLVDGPRVEGVPFELPRELWGRSMLVRKAERLDAECVIRGYLAGSAWEEYGKTGRVFGAPLPQGLREGDALPQPLFTPTTKAETGHDEPLSYEGLLGVIGAEAANVVRIRSGAVYSFAQELASRRGIIIADTKMEFGYIDGEICLIDELLTPDSSRFWDAAAYRPGGSQPSFDKQYVRDWLLASGWDRVSPPPELPPDVVERTAEKYREAYRRLTGGEVRLWP
jgi:phosphoribosylaminoimidazole-succinocarboxamide synthase